MNYFVAAAYFIAAVLFLLGLKRMASPRTARSGIQWAGVGMVLAVIATFFLPGTTGALIHGSVAPLAGETVVEKHFPNSFRDTPLLGLLQAQNITDIAIAGMMTHMCVDTTTRAAFDLGFTCHLAHDACATRDLAHDGKTVCAADVQTAYMAALGQVFAQVRSTQELCAAISQSR